MVGNKKWMIALFSICLVVIAGLLTTVIVLASPSQTISSNIGIQYTVRDIDGSMSASYKVGTSGSDTPIATKIEFNQGTDSISGNFNVPNITGLSPSENYVTFTYTFTNDIALDYTVDFTYTGTNADWSVQYTTVEGGSDGWQDMTSGTEVSGQLTVDGTTSDPTTKTLYIRVELNDTTADASFSGTFAFDLAGVPTE